MLQKRLELINSSNEKINDGSVLVEKAEKSIKNIVTSVDKVKVMISEINVAAREQSTGITQINQAISNLDGMTQQNSALVEEAAAAASLNEQAAGLSHVVDRFKVN